MQPEFSDPKFPSYGEGREGAGQLLSAVPPVVEWGGGGGGRGGALGVRLWALQS
jgi:hypothetical protein